MALCLCLSTDLCSFLFAGVISHELGHQLGLSHEKSPNDFMFVFSGQSRGDQIKWLNGIERNSLSFTKPQVKIMKAVLKTP